MSRPHTSSSRGRQLAQSGSRPLRTKDFSDETYQDPSSRRKRGPNGPSKYASSVQQNKRRRQASPQSSVSDSSEDFDAEDGSDELSDSDDVDEEDDLPAVFAPVHDELHSSVPGHTHISSSGPMPDSETGYDIGSMFPTARPAAVHDDLMMSAEDAAAFEREYVAPSSDDDALYEGVNYVSDSDDDNIDRLEEQQIIGEFEEQQIIADFEEDELYGANVLNDIDGFSSYGFGGSYDSDEGTVPNALSSQDEAETPEKLPRRTVRFQVDHSALLGQDLSQSPTFQRSLLPSPMVDGGEFPEGAGGIQSDLAEPEPEEPEDYDSDATEVWLPPLEQQMRAGQPEDDANNVADNDATTQATDGESASRNTSKANSGPPFGYFIDDGSKPSATLDRTGKHLVITDPHLLGDEFVRRYQDSAMNSPSAAFEELMDESDFDGSDVSALEAQGPFDDVDLDDYEDMIHIEDVISFEDDSDDEESDATPIPATPVFKHPTTPASARQHRHLQSLDSNTVTAFRRSANPQSAALRTTPSFAELSSPIASTAPIGRKRKNTYESPYASPHYNGVTPVQRISAYDHAQNVLNSQAILIPEPDSGGPSKRPRLMSA